MISNLDQLYNVMQRTRYRRRAEVTWREGLKLWMKASINIRESEPIRSPGRNMAGFSSTRSRGLIRVSDSTIRVGEGSTPSRGRKGKQGGREGGYQPVNGPGQVKTVEPRMRCEMSGVASGGYVSPPPLLLPPLPPPLPPTPYFLPLLIILHYHLVCIYAHKADLHMRNGSPPHLDS